MTRRTITTIAFALSLSAGSAGAQNIMFTTEGQFTGSGCSATELTSTFASCTSAGGVQLRYTFGEQQVLNQFGNAQFGSFATSGTGASSFADVLFALTIKQTSPTAAEYLVSAQIAGELQEIQGGLVWGPLDPTTFSIGVVNYTISTDQLTNGVRIDPPGVGGVVSSPQTIRGFVSTTSVPEPGSVALMLAGLAGLVVAARRRRTA